MLAIPIFPFIRFARDLTSRASAFSEVVASLIIVSTPEYLVQEVTLEFIDGIIQFLCHTFPLALAFVGSLSESLDLANLGYGRYKFLVCRMDFWITTENVIIDGWQNRKNLFYIINTGVLEEASLLIGRIVFLQFISKVTDCLN